MPFSKQFPSTGSYFCPTKAKRFWKVLRGKNLDLTFANIHSHMHLGVVLECANMFQMQQCFGMCQYVPNATVFWNVPRWVKCNNIWNVPRWVKCKCFGMCQDGSNATMFGTCQDGSNASVLECTKLLQNCVSLLISGTFQLTG